MHDREIRFYSEDLVEQFQRGGLLKFTLIYEHANNERKLIAVLLNPGMGHSSASEKVQNKPYFLDFAGAGNVTGGPEPNAEWNSSITPNPLEEKELLEDFTETLKAWFVENSKDASE